MFDVVSQQYIAPHFEASTNEAIRNFDSEIKLASMRKESLLCTNAKDFDLYYIGDFDNESGLLCPICPPELIYRGSEVICEINTTI